MTRAGLYDQTPIEEMTPLIVQQFGFPRFGQLRRMHGSALDRLRLPLKAGSDTRPYQPGDPGQFIDWRSFARSDKLLIRQETAPSGLRVGILVDFSPTQFWPVEPELLQLAKQTKIQVTLRLATCLAMGHLLAGDAVHWWFWRDPLGKDLQKISVPSTSRMMEIYHAWYKNPELAPAPLGGTPATVSDTRFGASLFYVISDGMGSLPWEDFMVGHGPAMFLHLLSRLEVESAWFKNAWSYEPALKSYEQYHYRDLTQENAYDKHLKIWQRDLEKQAHRLGGHYVALSGASFFGTVLSASRQSLGIL